MNPYADIAEWLGTGEVHTVFDVGANVGQSATKLAHYFPSAQIHSFEPVEASHDAGRKATAKLAKVHWHRTAVGDASGHVEFYSAGTSQLASITNLSVSSIHGLAEKNAVPVVTLDDFCAEHSITQIDVLKTDTEGYDVRTLRGAKGMFSSEAVGCVLCETGFSSEDKSHSPFLEVTPYLEKFGFKLYQFYGLSDKRHYQQWGWTYGDALFVKQREPKASPSKGFGNTVMPAHVGR